jgi:hypothetical protein
MSGRSDLRDIEVFLRRETQRAFGIANPNGSADLIWLPKSQCEIEPKEGPGKPDILTAPEWLLKERGLI